MKSLLLSTAFFLISLCLGAQSEDLRVFPNPVADRFEIGHSERVATVRVVNMVGREVKTYAFSGASYDVADLPQGMYLVQLVDREERVIHTQRVKKG